MVLPKTGLLLTAFAWVFVLVTVTKAPSSVASTTASVSEASTCFFFLFVRFPAVKPQICHKHEVVHATDMAVLIILQHTIDRATQSNSLSSSSLALVPVQHNIGM